MTKRKLILLDVLPDSFQPVCKTIRRQILPTLPCKIITQDKFLCIDTSGALVVEKWKSSWHYRNYHVRVTDSMNVKFSEGTTFNSAISAASILGEYGYHPIHKAIINDKMIGKCFLEYTSLKS
jgi:peroxiredoxin